MIYHCGLADVMKVYGLARFILAASSLEELAALPPFDLEELIQRLQGDVSELSGVDAFKVGINIAVLRLLYLRWTKLLVHDGPGAELLYNAAKTIHVVQ